MKNDSDSHKDMSRVLPDTVENRDLILYYHKPNPDLKTRILAKSYDKQTPFLRSDNSNETIYDSSQRTNWTEPRRKEIKHAVLGGKARETPSHRPKGWQGPESPYKGFEHGDGTDGADDDAGSNERHLKRRTSRLADDGLKFVGGMQVNETSEVHRVNFTGLAGSTGSTDLTRLANAADFNGPTESTNPITHTTSLSSTIGAGFVTSIAVTTSVNSPRSTYHSRHAREVNSTPLGAQMVFSAVGGDVSEGIGESSDGFEDPNAQAPSKDDDQQPLIRAIGMGLGVSFGCLILALVLFTLQRRLVKWCKTRRKQARYKTRRSRDKGKGHVSHNVTEQGDQIWEQIELDEMDPFNVEDDGSESDAEPQKVSHGLELTTLSPRPSENGHALPGHTDRRVQAGTGNPSAGVESFERPGPESAEETCERIDKVDEKKKRKDMGVKKRKMERENTAKGYGEGSGLGLLSASDVWADEQGSASDAQSGRGASIEVSRDLETVNSEGFVEQPVRGKEMV